MTFDDYIRRNYTELIEIASRVFKRTNVEPEEIIHELYLDIKENKRDIKPTQHDFHCYSKRWIKSRLRWTGGNVINDLKIDDSKTDDIERFRFRLSVDPDEIKTEIQQDLENIGFTSEQAIKIESCVIYSRTLPLYHKRLFELYYLDGMSCQKIADSCQLPKTSIHREIKKLNIKIKTNGKNHSTI